MTLSCPGLNASGAAALVLALVLALLLQARQPLPHGSGGASVVCGVQLDGERQPLRIAGCRPPCWADEALALAVGALRAAGVGLPPPPPLRALDGGSNSSSLKEFLEHCVHSARPCIVRGSAGDAANLSVWASPDALVRALGARDVRVHPMMEPGGSPGGASGGAGQEPPAPPVAFSQHTHTTGGDSGEATACSAWAFQERAAAGRDRMQLRLSLVELRRLRERQGALHTERWRRRRGAGAAAAPSEPPAGGRLLDPPAVFGRSDCCLARQGVWFEHGDGAWAPSPPPPPPARLPAQPDTASSPPASGHSHAPAASCITFITDPPSDGSFPPQPPAVLCCVLLWLGWSRSGSRSSRWQVLSSLPSPPTQLYA
jgi:hypothetical protein